jgi:type II secretory pathway component PulF
MSEFIYKARDISGVMVEGIVEAPTAGEASTVLADRQLSVVTLVPRTKRHFYDLSLSSLGAIFSGIKARDIVVFSRQLSVLVSANVAIVQALRTVQRQTNSVKLRAVLGDAANDVEGGSRLSTALGKYPKAFSAFYTNMVRSGETSGRVEEVLNYLADQLEKDYDLLSKVKGSMYYPAFIVCGMIVAGFIMMAFVVPKLTQVLTDTGGTLPLPTKILIAVSSFFAGFWWLILIVIGGAIGAGIWYTSTPDGKRLLSRVELRIPIFGGIYQRLAVVRMVRSMKTLLEGGVDAVSALEVTADVVGNLVYRELILQTISEVRDGRPISTVFTQHPRVVPAMVSQMLTVGEETGRLTEILDKLAGFYSREIDNLVGGLVTLIEPIIILIIGVAVALLVAAIILPMYSMANSF